MRLLSHDCFTRVSAFTDPSSPYPFLSSYTVVKDMSLKKAAIGAIPAAIAAPAFAMDSIVDVMPSTSLSLEVQFGAYLAILLGTFLPCLFLINLFIQTESRKAGKAGGQDAE